MSKAIGIDYSLTGPAACQHPLDKPWNISNCKFVYMTSNIRKYVYKYSVKNITFEGLAIPDYDNNMMRFIQNAKIIKTWCSPEEGDSIAIEGYSFGSKGRSIFQIGEATGILVLFMMFNSSGSGFINNKRVPYRPAPTEIKKMATDKGNASKDQMYDAWLDETKIDLKKLFDTSTIKSPINDIVDSYWICKWVFQKEVKSNE